MSEEDSDVLSDVHLQLAQRDGVTTLCWEEEQTTKNECVVVDADGDLEPPRKRSKKAAVALAHRLATPVADVGLQVWRGALLLGDYFFEHPPVAVKLAELGAGVGAAGLLAATLGADVLATDGHAGAVALAAANGDRNAAAISRARPGTAPLRQRRRGRRFVLFRALAAMLRTSPTPALHTAGATRRPPSWTAPPHNP